MFLYKKLVRVSPSLHCKTTNTGLVHCVAVSLYFPAVLPVRNYTACTYFYLLKILSFATDFSTFSNSLYNLFYICTCFMFTSLFTTCTANSAIWREISHERWLIDKGKGKSHLLDIAPIVKGPHCRRAQVWHMLSRNFTVLPAHPRVYPRTEWTIPVFAFPAEACPHLPTPEGWTAELA